MSKFIELTSSDSSKFLANTDLIAIARKDAWSEDMVIKCDNGQTIEIRESYEEVKAMLMDEGK